MCNVYTVVKRPSINNMNYSDIKNSKNVKMFTFLDYYSFEDITFLLLCYICHGSCNSAGRIQMFTFRIIYFVARDCYYYYATRS